jgi:predicted nucleotidyltransferase
MGIIEILCRARSVPERDFLIIGGHAIGAHGYSRQTIDLDILIPKSQKNYWKELLLEKGYEVHSEREAFAQFNHPIREMWPVDFMLVNENTFSGMYEEAVKGVLHGMEVKYPSLFHLIALKLHVIKQGMPHRELKDLNDVVQLVLANGIDVKSAEFKQLCEKYGNLRAYETIARATQ